MSFISIDSEILNTNIDGQALKLYCLLESYCYGDKKDCFPSQNTLATRMNKSIRTIQRYLKTLKNLGLVIIKRRGSTSNLYILPKKLNKKVQETAQKIQKKCSDFRAALKTRKSNANKSSMNIHNTDYNISNNTNSCSNNSYSNYSNIRNNGHSNTFKNHKKSYKTNTFNDYTQRKYDFSKLEKALLGNASFEYEEVLE
ncbi:MULTISPECIES: helix-turn-helix domain-containing protein [Clostridiaceae]|uniref:helix-turn-helix domain-containing protein n=1 Tax=Clostridiaceae TaxID=31979 RepID=UPI00068ED62D|nr:MULTISPECIES: helix-turn-helix domain-containing protein [Clostridiaceae]